MIIEIESQVAMAVISSVSLYDAGKWYDRSFNFMFSPIKNEYLRKNQINKGGQENGYQAYDL
jgi:hypothetical protein